MRKKIRHHSSVQVSVMYPGIHSNVITGSQTPVATRKSRGTWTAGSVRIRFGARVNIGFTDLPWFVKIWSPGGTLHVTNMEVKHGCQGHFITFPSTSGGIRLPC